MNDELCDDGTDDGIGCPLGCLTESLSCNFTLMNYVEVINGESFNLVQKGASYVTSICDEICGNNVTGSSETCDDGNLIDNDGCSSSC